MDFQTPTYLASYMARLLPEDAFQILEPTPGEGKLVAAARHRFPQAEIITFDEYPPMFDNTKYQCAIMNPPFTPMSAGYKCLDLVMNCSNNIVALMPWLTLINGDKRRNKIFSFGLQSITMLPRNVFPGARVQCCILNMRKKYKGETIIINW